MNRNDKETDTAVRNIDMVRDEFADFSDGAEICIDDVLDFNSTQSSSNNKSSSFYDSPSSFFDKTSENVNAALLKFLESVFPKNNNRASFSGNSNSPNNSIHSSNLGNSSDSSNPSNSASNVNSNSFGNFDMADNAPVSAKKDAEIYDHPWFHPPKKEGFSIETSDEFAFLSPNSKQNFFRQAKLFADKEGTVQEEVAFSSYFPQYSSMTPKQLDWYFYWRSNIRTKIFIQTDVSYIFLYFYELIHLIGFASAREALNQILFVWKEAHYKNTVFDSYLVAWVRDFILYYGLDLEYYDVIEGVLGEKTAKYLFQECILYFFDGESKPGFLYAFERCSDYSVSDGRFYKDGYDSILEDAICSILLAWNKKYQQKGSRDFLTAICGDNSNKSNFRPFDSAFFYEYGQSCFLGDDRLNSKILYSFSSRVIASTLIPGLSEMKKVRKFITGLLRTIESLLRDFTGYRWSIQKGHLSKGNLSLIEKQCTAFYQEHLAAQKLKEKKIFHVNNDILVQLKADSEHIRQHLISQQEQSRETGSEFENTQVSKNEIEFEKITNDEDSLVEAGKIENDFERAVHSDCDYVNVENGGIDQIDNVDYEQIGKSAYEFENADAHRDEHENPLPAFPANPFSLLFSQLTSEQLQIISLLYKHTSSPGINQTDCLHELRRIASVSNSFPNVIIEEINNLAIDFVGDCIIDFNGAMPSIYQDYLCEIKETISNGCE